MLRTMSAMVMGLACVAACTKDPAPTRAQKKPRAEVVVLATGDEINPAALLEAWRRDEHHCLDGGCATLALSTGGHATLPEDLGYAAAALTSGLVDGGVPHLSTNWPQATASIPVTRLGMNLQLLGLTRPRDGGVELAPVEAALLAVQLPYFMQGPNGTILISDVCVDELAEIIQRRGISWPFLLVAIGRTCGANPAPRHVYSTLILASGEGDAQYARASLTFDQNTAALLKADGALITLPTGR